MSPQLENLIVTVALSDARLAEVKAAFPNVFYHPANNGAEVPEKQSRIADIWLTSWNGLPPYIKSVEQIPRTKIVQLSSAGANRMLATEVMQTEKAKQSIKICSASGIHTVSIPQYVVANAINLYMKLHIQFHLARTRAEWPTLAATAQAAGAAGQIHPENRLIGGKTVGLLGYGHIARETARLFQAFNCKIIAANSKGDRRPEEGYRLPNTGDADGSIPEQYYSSTDPKSFAEFLARCDVLVASLPSTPQTTYMLTEKHLRESTLAPEDADPVGMLPEGSVFINIGRGDLVKSEDILAALDAPGGLSGVALDVTDPEPLPAGHPLYTHPGAIITGHTSGNFENYYDLAAGVLLAQAERIAKGEDPFNVVDPAKGY
ncbi:hypothetical protein IAT38_007930 [Cryptococcus sp. DSM 104549]